MKRRLTAVLLAGLLAGCALPGEKIAAPPTVPTGARSGGTLTVGITTPSGIDPADAYEPVSQLVSGALCDTLVSTDPVTGRAVPGLLRAWQVSGDTITLQLRHGIRFNDGSVLSAKDVAFSLNRLANPIYASREAGLLYKIAGYAQLSQNLFAEPDAHLPGVQVVDDYDLQIILPHKDPGFLLALAQVATAPVSADATRAHPKQAATDPVCVGPYRLHHPYQPGDSHIVLDRSPHYYSRNVAWTGGGRGYADHIDFEIFPTAAAASSAARKGLLDLVVMPPVGTTPRGFAVTRAPAAQLEVIGLPDGLDNALSGPAVHRALSEALNRQALIAAVWHGRQLPADGFLPPGLGKDTAGTGCGTLTPATGDIAGARTQLTAVQLAALAKAQITFYVNDDYANRAEVTEVARQWQAAFGLHSIVKVLPWAQYLARGTVGAGFDGPFRLSWAAGTATPTPTDSDPAHFLGEVFLSGATQAGNWAHFSDQRFDLGYSDDLTPADGVSRRQWLQRSTAYLCSQMPVIPVAFGQSPWLVRASLASARPSYLAVGGAPMLREIYRR